jgi:hypothetical protein
VPHGLAHSSDELGSRTISQRTPAYPGQVTQSRFHAHFSSLSFLKNPQPLRFPSHLDDTCRGFFEDAFFKSAHEGGCEDLLLCSPSAGELLPVILEENNAAFCATVWAMAGSFLHRTYTESDKLVEKEKSAAARPQPARLVAVCSQTGVALPQRPGRAPCFVYEDQGYCYRGKLCQ